MSDESAAIEAGQATATTRRGMLAGAGAVGAAAVLAACGTDQGVDPYSGQPVGADPAGTPSAPATGTPAPAGTPSTAPEEQEGEASGLVATEDVPAGGGVLVNDEIVVTQPTAGEWRGFSAVCTHQGCTVASVSDGTINCNCHGSKFSIADGSVVNGPAQQPLAEQAVAVQDGWVVLA
jgi:Rieske Fe-S protein